MTPSSLHQAFGSSSSMDSPSAVQSAMTTPFGPFVYVSVYGVVPSERISFALNVSNSI